jgi:hypothetical protein
MKMLSPGTRVRAKVRAIGGWKGLGTVMRIDTDTGLIVIRMDYPPLSTTEVELIPSCLGRSDLLPLRSLCNAQR